MNPLIKLIHLFKPKMVTQSRPDHRTYYMDIGPSGNIGWASHNELSKRKDFFDIYGYKSPCPVPGDLLFVKTRDKRTAIFIFSYVKDKHKENGEFTAKVCFSTIIGASSEIES